MKMKAFVLCAAALSAAYGGLLLRGGIVLECLEWKGDDFAATLKLADGTVKRVEGKAGDGVTLSVDGQTAHNVVEYCPKGVNR